MPIVAGEPAENEALRRVGMRPTRQRVAVLRTIRAGGRRHLTPESFHQELADAGLKLSLATVYNTLNQFAESGLLRRVGFATAPISAPTPRRTTISTMTAAAGSTTSPASSRAWSACRRRPTAWKSAASKSSSASAGPRTEPAAAPRSGGAPVGRRPSAQSCGCGVLSVRAGRSGNVMRGFCPSRVWRKATIWSSSLPVSLIPSWAAPMTPTACLRLHTLPEWK